MNDTASTASSWAPKLLVRLWAFPNTAVGLTLGLGVLALGGRARWPRGHLEFFGGVLGRTVDRWTGPGGFAALTQGHVIQALDRESLDALRAHELVHVRQYERWGAAFIPAYLLAGLWLHLRGQNGYRANPFERQAHVLARRTSRGDRSTR